ncbi:MAG: LysE family translocator [Bacteroidales bacterium]|nr:MAG: LysE family translocator [Bacteroidales bacterium]
MSAYLLLGISMGLTAGLSPGPLLMLLISETIKQNRKAGILIACVPLITDLPIVLISLFILNVISDYHYILGIISILGAIYLGYQAYENIRLKNIAHGIDELKPKSLKKGIITNFLNPNPYLFWMTIGAPTVIKGYSTGIFLSLSFVIAFYLFLVGSKIIVALLVDRSKSLLKSSLYVILVRILGLILLGFSLLFIKEGLIHLQLLK